MCEREKKNQQCKSLQVI
uniref:Uncharacterized protein n=1 Tax=Anguilla anguilla TaxID=7936 RepID=A0A0E9VY55_ANGAN